MATAAVASRKAARRVGFMADPPDVVVAALWNLPAGLNTAQRPDHSGLMLANLITLAHFSVSAAMKAAKPSGEPGNGVAPRSASLALILGSASAARSEERRVG